MRANVCGRIGKGRGERKYTLRRRKVFQLGNRETEVHNAREKMKMRARRYVYGYWNICEKKIVMKRLQRYNY